MSVSSTAQIRLITVGLVLIVCNVLCINLFLVSKAQSFLESRCESPKAHLSLRAYEDSSYTRDIGPVKWELDSNPLGISLGANRTQIIVNFGGHYIVFVQAVFYLNKSAVELSEDDGVIRLRLQLNTNDSAESTESELVAAWEEREVKELRDEQIVRLSFMVQVELQKYQYVRIKARHLDKLNYDEPVSTTLTIFRYADLQDGKACAVSPFGPCCDPKG
ncbi:hypothetical protein ACEWY4_004489 [Coilia grayii]|uniref:TNF family profile domain-containing protein n=1 Tax=Coilia grayii TaxID=363190 RepID=A0ABD1KLP3_9TELE